MQRTENTETEELQLRSTSSEVVVGFDKLNELIAHKRAGDVKLWKRQKL